MPLRILRLVSLSAAALMLAAGFLTASDPDKTRLSLEWISQDSYKSVGMSPRNIHWSEDGRRIYFQWNPDRKKDSELFWVTPQGGVPQRVPESERWKLPEGRGDRNEQGTHTVYSKFSDLFLLDISTGQAKRLTRTTRAESNPRFLLDGRRFTFQADRQLFLFDIETGAVTQLTDIRPGSDPDKKKPKTDQERFLKTQQEELFDIVKRRKDDKERGKARRLEQDPRPEPFYLGSKQKRVVSLRPSPDGSRVAVLVSDFSQQAKGRLPVMPRYVTDSGFVEAREIRRGEVGGRFKVGAPGSKQRAGVYDVESGQMSWLEVDLGEREINHNSPVWARDSSKLSFVIGSVDNKDRWVAVHDFSSDKTEIVDHERDEAWIRDLRAGNGNPRMGWLADNDTFWFLSERSKWWHLYLCKTSTKEVRQLTSGNWEIGNFLEISKDLETFYFTASTEHPGDRQIYSLAASGGQPQRLSSMAGWHSPRLSPDEKRFATGYTHSDKPTELAFMANAPQAQLRVLTDSTTDEFKGFDLPKPEIVTFPDADGNLIYADLYLPEARVDDAPAVLYIHGAGYTQAVYKRWSGARLLHHFLAQQGFVVLSIDYRGSAGYGRDCRTAVYRHMGGKDVDSALAAVDYLASEHAVDRKKVGLYGASYGGFFTLMALFQHPGAFAAGVAVVPVTDWAHYNHGYTARILNLPFEDEEAYERSSPIYFADGLQDRLLLVDGLEDDNVLVQDTLRLSQRLIELEKDTWDMHIYPIEPHGFRQESSRLDYLRRLTRFFETHLDSE